MREVDWTEPSDAHSGLAAGADTQLPDTGLGIFDTDDQHVTEVDRRQQPVTFTQRYSCNVMSFKFYTL